MNFALLFLLAALTLLPFTARAEPAPIFGENFGITIHPHKITDADIEKIAELGFHSVRTNINWNEVERREGTYNWDYAQHRDPEALDFRERRFFTYDDQIKKLRERGLHVAITVSGGNPLYTGPLIPVRFGKGYYPFPAAPRTPEAVQAFAAFAGATAAHYTELYGHDAFTWLIWNEPDFDSGFPPKTDGAAVGRVVETTCRTIKETVPDARVMGPALSVDSLGEFHHSFIQDLFLEANPLACLDAFTLHPYRPHPPETAPADYRKMAKAIARFQPEKPVPIAVDEWGYTTTPPEEIPETMLWRDFTQEEQAALFLRLYLVNLAAGVPYTVTYEWQDSGTSLEDAEENYGLIRANGEEKPSVQMMRHTWPRLKGRRLFQDVRAKGCDKKNVTLMRFSSETTGTPDILVAWTSVPSEGLSLRVPAESATDAFGHAFPANAPLPLTGVPLLIEIPQGARPSVVCE